MPTPACPPSPPSVGLLAFLWRNSILIEIRASIAELAGSGDTYQRLHSTMESMSVVASELGVNALEGGITVRLGLLDTVFERSSVFVRLSAYSA